LVQHAGVVSHAILVRLQWCAVRGNVGGGNNMQEILVRDEGCGLFDEYCSVALVGRSLTLVGYLERVIQGLCHVRKIRPKRKLISGMRKVQLY
jgi:hypothetical protein